MARQYGLDGESVDYSTLGDAIARDTRFQSQNAGDMPAAEAEKTAQTRSEASGAVRAHVAELTRQGEKLRETFPGFDLAREMKNPTFLRLTAPGTGVSVEDAYFAVHREELQRMAMQVTAQKAVAKLANSIQAGALRPQEAGTGAQAPSTISFDYRNASPEQRAAIKKRIRDAAARGEKLYPGGRTTP